METGNGDGTLFEYAFALIGSTYRVASIIDNWDIMSLGDSINRLEVAIVTKHMDWHNSNSMAGNLLFYLRSINIQRLWVNIYKDRSTVLPHNRTNCGNKGKRWSNNLTLFTNGLDSHLKSKCTVTTAHHIGNLQVFTYFFFKTLYQRSIMRHNTAFPNALHQFVDFLQRGQRGHRHINWVSHPYIV